MSRQDSRQISNVKIMLKQGAEGVGIVDVEKTGSVGLVDTYALIMSDGTRHTFEVTNGNGIASIEKTSTSGLVDTYTITFDDGTTYDYNVTNGQDGEDGGMSAKILITSNAGATVTVTLPSGRVKTATQVSGSTTQWECYTTEYGTHTVSSTLSGYTQTGTVSVDQCKIYTITVTHFTATITVTYTAGASCTCVGGSESYTATSNPQTFTVHHADTYVLTVSNGVETVTENVVISTNGQSENVTVNLSTEITINLYSASNDTVSYTDFAGTKTCVTDSQGKGTATIRIPANGMSITFTSSIADDPDDLSNKFSKTMTVYPSTLEIDVMPQLRNKMMYWYGFMRYCTPATASDIATNSDVSPVVNPTYNSNDIYIRTRVSGSGVMFSGSGIKRTSEINMTKAKAIVKKHASGNYKPIILTVISNVEDPNKATTTSTSKTLLTYEASGSLVPDLFIRTFNNDIDESADIYGLWVE